MALRPFMTTASPAAITAAEKRRVLHASSITSTAVELEARDAAHYHLSDSVAGQFTQSERRNVLLDEVQQSAQHMFATEQFANLIGYAGTGKTTTMKGVLPIVKPQVRLIDWGAFRTAGVTPSMQRRPAIALCCFTNIAARNLASKLPEEWADHCLSIHAMLCYQPVGVDEFGEATQRFEPRYHAANKLPLDAIFIDEAGTVPGDLWGKIIDAVEPTTRIYLLGDLAQNPAMYSPSPLPFAMTKWPTVVLDRIYRQEGDSQIIPNLTRIRSGLPPIHSAKDFRCDAQTVLPRNAIKARQHIHGYLSTLFKLGLWDPKQDIIITGYNESMLGQEHWNGAFRIAFNPPVYEGKRLTNPPVLINTAISSVTLAVGDKVMATDNGGRTSREKRFNNGSIGIVVDIRPNDRYTGSWDGIGEIEIVDNADLRAAWEAIREAETGVEASNGFDGIQEAEVTEDKKSRAASHIVTVVEQATGDIYELSRSAEISSLQHAYAVTCHKFQGSQARNVIVLCHSSMPNALNREWLYTACSRAQNAVFLLHEPAALITACNRARLPGKTAQEKARQLVDIYSAQRAWAMPSIPDARKLGDTK